MSRQSSTERKASDMLPEMAAAGAEIIVDKIMTLTNKKKKVEQVDFDELFARGLAMSDESDNVPIMSDQDVQLQLPMIQFQQETGITFDVENVPERGRKRHRSKKNHTTEGADPVSGSDRPVSQSVRARARTQSREYSKPQDIKLSPVTVKRDLFTGKLMDGTTEEEVFLKKVTKFISKNQDHLRELSESRQLNPIKSIEFKKSPFKEAKEPEKEVKTSGKSFLDVQVGQEMFSKSIEEDFIPMQTQLTENLGEPADKTIPKILKPDCIMKNEKFYEDLRSGLKTFASQNQDERSKYSHHLGRAEFGSLKKRTPIESKPINVPQTPRYTIIIIQVTIEIIFEMNI